MVAPAVDLYGFQKRWLLDRSRFKIGNMSRQIGKSFIVALEVVDEDDGTSALDAISHSRLEGAIEICTILLQEMGYEPQPKPTPAPEPQPGKEDGF